MNKLRYAFYRFMQGRYGGDALSMTLIILAFIMTLVSNVNFTGSFAVAVSANVLLLMGLLRTFSKNITRRRNENYAFLAFTAPVRLRIKILISNIKDPHRKYFLCPQCHKITRIPKRRGKVDITCPTCRHKFSGRS